MIKIKVVAAGRIKERALSELIGEYAKRLSKYCTLTIVEVPDESVAARESEADVRRGLLAESGRLLGRIAAGEYVIALDIKGDATDSPGFSKMLNDLAARHSALAFVIGGSNGLHPDVISRADRALSLSRLTFPHQLARLILLEQIYRAFKINNNETYHK